MASSCPVDDSATDKSPDGAIPVSLANACPTSQAAAGSPGADPGKQGSGPPASPCPSPSAGASQTSADALPQLSRERVESTIPSVSGEPFQYPSERQFYGAASAKGHTVDPDDMPTVVAIHNSVNERAWQEILRYERLHVDECATSKLLHFIGRPGDLSPKARWRGFTGHTLPFDRHDWHVDRCGVKVRYLVDFYDGKPSSTHQISIHVDARPEVSVNGVVDRFRLWVRDRNIF